MNELPEGSPLPLLIIRHFHEMPDPRINRRRPHLLVDILTIGLCTLVAGGEHFTDMEAFGKAKEKWLRTFLKLPEGIPSHDTFTRVFSAIDPAAFLDCFVRWVRAACPSLDGEVVAIDGKALRHALNEGDSIPFIVSAWASKSGLALGQVKVNDKSNEITAIPELLDAIDLDGCVVTIDAMGCQKKIAALIADKKADYVLALKGNHATVLEEIEAFFADAVAPCATRAADCVAPGTMDFFKTRDKDHGRLETRCCWQSTDIDWFEDKPLWKHLRSIGMVESIRKVKGKSSVERRFFLSSLPLNAQNFAEAVRGHWGVENALHWTLDVTFREDYSRARTKHAAQNMATLRRIALNLIKNGPPRKNSLRQRRLLAALDDSYLGELLGI